MIKIENEFLEAHFKIRGAELSRVFHKKFKLDYLWNANPDYWAKSAPVLFPIVGTLKDDTFFYKGKKHSLPRHGFARDKDFRMIHQDENSIHFEMKNDAATLSFFPFAFTLRIKFILEENKLTNVYEVINEDTQTLFFSIGGHPAFNVPLEKNQRYTDYFLEFETAETAPRWVLNKNLINPAPASFLDHDCIIPLSHQLFAQDAVVLKNLKSKSICLKSRKSTRGLRMRIEEFPYLGIWAAPAAPFVCIEPWHGIADSPNHNQNLEEKEGIINLPASGRWSKSWDVTFF